MAVAALDAAVAEASVSAPQTYSVSAGANRALIVGYLGEGTDAGAVSIAYGGQSMTSVVEGTVSSGGTFGRSQLFILLEAGIAAASGSDIVVTNGQGNFVTGASSFTGVNQATPTNIDSASADASTPNPVTGCSIVASDGSGVVAASMSGTSATQSWAAPLDQDAKGTTQGGTMAGSIALCTLATGQTVDALNTWSAQSRAVVCALELAPHQILPDFLRGPVSPAMKAVLTQ